VSQNTDSAGEADSTTVSVATIVVSVPQVPQGDTMSAVGPPQDAITTYESIVAAQRNETGYIPPPPPLPLHFASLCPPPTLKSLESSRPPPWNSPTANGGAKHPVKGDAMLKPNSWSPTCVVADATGEAELITRYHVEAVKEGSPASTVVNKDDWESINDGEANAKGALTGEKTESFPGSSSIRSSAAEMTAIDTRDPQPSPILSTHLAPVGEPSEGGSRITVGEIAAVLQSARPLALGDISSKGTFMTFQTTKAPLPPFPPTTLSSPEHPQQQQTLIALPTSASSVPTPTFKSSYEGDACASQSQPEVHGWQGQETVKASASRQCQNCEELQLKLATLQSSIMAMGESPALDAEEVVTLRAELSKAREECARDEHLIAENERLLDVVFTLKEQLDREPLAPDVLRELQHAKEKVIVLTIERDELAACVQVMKKAERLKGTSGPQAGLRLRLRK
jgi:hypothetical protein